MKFEREKEKIYRLKVPFDNLYTSVFLIKANNNLALVDCATFDSDVDNYIVPALSSLNLFLTDIKYLILTHCHEDHAGGIARILELAPNIEVVQSVKGIDLSGITLCYLKGHTLDCIGVFDKKSKTLISGDGLQGDGVEKYRCSVINKEEYLKTIKMIEDDESIENILFSHAYEPWYKDYARGREEVKRCLKDCKKTIIGENK